MKKQQHFNMYKLMWKKMHVKMMLNYHMCPVGFERLCL